MNPAPNPDALPPTADSHVPPPSKSGDGWGAGGPNGSGGSGPRGGLDRLLCLLPGLSAGPGYLLLAAASPHGFATAESSRRHGAWALACVRSPRCSEHLAAE